MRVAWFGWVITSLQPSAQPRAAYKGTSLAKEELIEYVINAEKVRMTGKKWTDRVIFKYSGYPGGQKLHTPALWRQKSPERLIEHSVRGMLPKNSMGRQLFRSLHVYAGTAHPHEAQQPKEIKF